MFDYFWIYNKCVFAIFAEKIDFSIIVYKTNMCWKLKTCEVIQSLN